MRTRPLFVFVLLITTLGACRPHRMAYCDGPLYQLEIQFLNELQQRSEDPSALPMLMSDGSRRDILALLDKLQEIQIDYPELGTLTIDSADINSLQASLLTDKLLLRESLCEEAMDCSYPVPPMSILQKRLLITEPIIYFFEGKRTQMVFRKAYVPVEGGESLSSEAIIRLEYSLVSAVWIDGEWTSWTSEKL